MTTLTPARHDRDAAGLQYIYPVMSRRAGGLSVGVNFNTNNACNWQCIYCQVPNLTVGAAPKLDLALLEGELRFFLNDVLHGDFFERYNIAAPDHAIKDIAMSGNGEPTSVENFSEAVATIGKVATDLGVFPPSRFVLITNGSLIHQHDVQAGLQQLQAFGGEVWFKLDSATKAGRAGINRTGQSLENSLRNLALSASLCHTKIQTCLLDYAGQGLDADEQAAYLAALQGIKTSTGISEVLLYTLARPPLQPGAERLRPLGQSVLDDFADKVREIGYTISVAY